MALDSSCEHISMKAENSLKQTHRNVKGPGYFYPTTSETREERSRQEIASDAEEGCKESSQGCDGNRATSVLECSYERKPRESEAGEACHVRELREARSERDNTYGGQRRL